MILKLINDLIMAHSLFRSTGKTDFTWHPKPAWSRGFAGVWYLWGCFKGSFQAETVGFAVARIREAQQAKRKTKPWAEHSSGDSQAGLERFVPKPQTLGRVQGLGLRVWFGMVYSQFEVWMQGFCAMRCCRLGLVLSTIHELICLGFSFFGVLLMPLGLRAFEPFRPRL